MAKRLYQVKLTTGYASQTVGLIVGAGSMGVAVRRALYQFKRAYKVKDKLGSGVQVEMLRIDRPELKGNTPNEI